VVTATRVESVPCFAALPSAVRASLADAFDEIEVPAGEKLASQGDFAYQVFAIIEGSARVEQDGEALAMLGPGDLFGEVGLLLTGRRTATVVAETPMVVLALFDQPFRRLSKEYPAFADVVREQCQGRFAGPAATV
jgi:CRP/FNR family transcriptional regulator, cyclic AMP receptor protein